MTDNRTHRPFPVNLPTDLYDAFFKMFPEYGARSTFIREAIRAVLRQKGVEVVIVDDAAGTALDSAAMRSRTNKR